MIDSYPCKFLSKNVRPLRPNNQMVWQICSLCHVVINVTFPAGERRKPVMKVTDVVSVAVVMGD